MVNWREKSLLLTKCYDPFDVISKHLLNTVVKYSSNYWLKNLLVLRILLPTYTLSSTVNFPESHFKGNVFWVGFSSRFPWLNVVQVFLWNSGQWCLMYVVLRGKNNYELTIHESWINKRSRSVSEKHLYLIT